MAFEDAADYVDDVERGKSFVITGPRVKKLLLEWANTARGDAEQDALRLLNRWPDVFAPLPNNSNVPGRKKLERVSPEHLKAITRVQYYINRAWGTADMRAREWFIFRARLEWKRWTSGEPDLDAEPPGPTTFESVMGYFHIFAPYGRHCPNPMCPAPRFFATKKNQRFCSKSCSAPTQRAQKLAWWAAHRKEMAKKRRKR